jgi:ABC-2 type transport system permease protein
MFQKRLLASYQFNLKLWRSLLDWTVTAYIVIPSIVIGFFLYRDFLISNPSFTISPTTFLTVLLLCSFLFCKSTVRLFIYDADLLFLRQNIKKFLAIKTNAMIYNFFSYNLLMLLLLIVITPLLLVANFTFIHVVKVLVIFNLISILRIIGNYSIHKWYIQWPLFLLIHAIIIFNFFKIPLAIYMISFFICCVLLVKKVDSNRYWSIEISWECEAFYKWMKRIYSLGEETRYYLPKKSRDPFIIFAKKRKLSKHRLDNLIYKTILRKFDYMSLPLRLILLCIGLLFILPTAWAKGIVLIITLMGLFTATDSIIKDIKQAPFFQLMTVSQEQWYSSKLRIQKRLLYPMITLLLILFFIV